MRVVRDRGDARWLPSRFRFALFRLIAYFMLRAARQETAPGTIMAIEPDQSAVENYLVAGMVFLMTASFTAALLAAVMPFVVACVLALPATLAMVQVPILGCGLTVTPLLRKLTGVPRERDMAINSAILMLLAIATAALLALHTSPLRHAGIAFLLLAGVNALAAVVVFLLRRAIADSERRFGVE